jgi:hypothetical protein
MEGGQVDPGKDHRRDQGRHHRLEEQQGVSSDTLPRTFD